MKKTNLNNLKYLYVLPAIILLFFTINSIGKTFNNKINSIQTQSLKDKIKIVIDKNTNDDEFSEIMKSLKEKGIIAEFRDVTRNENNEITAIQINITKNGSTSNYSANSNLGIDSIYIDIDGDFVSIHNKGIQVFGYGNTTDDEIANIMQQHQAILK